jgi:hypothetical protein
VSNRKLIKTLTKNCPLTTTQNLKAEQNTKKLQKDSMLVYFGFQMHVIAFWLQAEAQGMLPFSGLQGEQVYLIFLRCSSVTAATILSSRSINIASICSAFSGHALMQSSQLLHFSASTTM